MNIARRRIVLVAGIVVLLHVAVLWVLQSGLLRRAVEVLVPVAVLSELIEPPLPKVEPPPPPPPPPSPKPPQTPSPRPPEQVKQAVIRKTPALPPPPMPIAIADPEPAPNAPTGVIAEPTPLPPITAPLGAMGGAPTGSGTLPGGGKVELPSSDAAYLQNPKPAYPAISRRQGEQGTVVLRVLIGVDGTAQKAEIRQSSGFERLDQAALATVQRWRYVPGKRGGVPEAMWFNVPVNFVLE